MSKLGGIGILWLYVLLVFSAVVLGLSASIVAQDHDSGIAIAHLVIVYTPILLSLSHITAYLPGTSYPLPPTTPYLAHKPPQSLSSPNTNHTPSTKKSTLGFTIPFLSCCLVFNQADDEAGAVGVAIGFLSLFAYTGLVIGLSKDPVASDRIFHNTEHGDDALTANPYYGLFVVDLIIMYVFSFSNVVVVVVFVVVVYISMSPLLCLPYLGTCLVLLASVRRCLVSEQCLLVLTFDTPISVKCFLFTVVTGLAASSD